MRFIFDVKTRELDLPPLTAAPYGGLLEGWVRTYGLDVKVSTMSFSITGTIGGKPFEYRWPNEDLALRGISSTADMSPLASTQVRWLPEDVIDLTVSLVTNTDTHERRVTFTAPRPDAPYPSWVWDSSSRSWEAPTPYPDDELDYVWDESQTAWLLYED